MIDHFVTIKMNWYHLAILFSDGIFCREKETNGRKNYFAFIWILSSSNLQDYIAESEELFWNLAK